MDFKQDLITTIHKYGVTEDSHEDLSKALKERATAIIIPCLFEEFKRPALIKTRDVLANLKSLNELVIALSAKSAEDVKAARYFFSSMPFPVHIQWTNGPSVIEVLKSQERNQSLR